MSIQPGLTGTRKTSSETRVHSLTADAHRRAASSRHRRRSSPLPASPGPRHRTPASQGPWHRISRCPPKPRFSPGPGASPFAACPPFPRSLSSWASPISFSLTLGGKLAIYGAPSDSGNPIRTRRQRRDSVGAKGRDTGSVLPGCGDRIESAGGHCGLPGENHWQAWDRATGSHSDKRAGAPSTHRHRQPKDTSAVKPDTETRWRASPIISWRRGVVRDVR